MAQRSILACSMALSSLRKLRGSDPLEPDCPAAKLVLLAELTDLFSSFRFNKGLQMASDLFLV